MPQTLDFPFFKDNATVDYIKNSHVLFLMRGLPGSGKSTIARAICEKYPNSTICSADDFFLQEDGSYQWSKEKLPEAHEQCHEKARKACESRINVIVIDCTMVRRWEMKFYVDLASKQSYTIILVSPKTPWCLDPKILASKNKHKVTEEILQEKKRAFIKEYVCPYYWGWFLDKNSTDCVLGRARIDFKNTVRCCKEFTDFYKNNDKDHTPLSFDKRYDRVNASANNLHCTAFFGGRNYNERAMIYSQQDAVKNAMGRLDMLCIVGLMITPRTVGARVKLSTEQLKLWGKDDTDDEGTSSDAVENLAKLSLEDTPKVSRFRPTRGVGSKAHLTLGCATGTNAVQTGIDQTSLIKLEAQRESDDSYVEIDGGAVRYYGQGRCIVYFNEPIMIPVLFSGIY